MSCAGRARVDHLREDRGQLVQGCHRVSRIGLTLAYHPCTGWKGVYLDEISRNIARKKLILALPLSAPPRPHVFWGVSGKYAIKGYPHKLGLLLHGPPGTGKTSMIKAIACHTGRNIVSVPLTRIKTNQVRASCCMPSRQRGRTNVRLPPPLPPLPSGGRYRQLHGRRE